MLTAPNGIPTGALPGLRQCAHPRPTSTLRPPCTTSLPTCSARRASSAIASTSGSRGGSCASMIAPSRSTASRWRSAMSPPPTAPRTSTTARSRRRGLRSCITTSRRRGNSASTSSSSASRAARRRPARAPLQPRAAGRPRRPHRLGRARSAPAALARLAQR